MRARSFGSLTGKAEFVLKSSCGEEPAKVSEQGHSSVRDLSRKKSIVAAEEGSEQGKQERSLGQLRSCWAKRTEEEHAALMVVLLRVLTSQGRQERRGLQLELLSVKTSFTQLEVIN